ncbi:MAG TPA: hypothetical protein VK903_06055 [Propionicimonas sp.]|nr:hypothetical protein [Propionicimonas sp.]
MAEESSEPGGTRRWWFIGAAALVVIALVWAVIAGAFAGGVPDATPTPSVTPTPTSGPATTPVPEPSLPSPTATGTPTVVPTAKATSVKTGLDDKAQTSPGVTARVVRVESVSGVAQGPGEIAGPALRVTIDVKNDSNKAIRTELGLINLYYGKARTPAGPLSGPGVAAFPEQIPAGGTGTGTSVFNVPLDERDRIEVEFSYSTDAAVVIFSGSA